MIGYRAVLGLNLFFGKSLYTNIFPNSNVQVSHTFTVSLKIRNAASIKYGFVKLDMMFLLATICTYVISFSESGLWLNHSKLFLGIVHTRWPCKIA